MNAKQWMEEADQVLMHTYGRYPVVLDRGEGVYLYDLDGKRYLDFGAGIAVFALGYGNRAYNEALKRQIDRLVHTSNYFYNVPAAEACRRPYLIYPEVSFIFRQIRVVNVNICLCSYSRLSTAWPRAASTP